jgi:multidrug efflux system outer membrane protein
MERSACTTFWLSIICATTYIGCLRPPVSQTVPEYPMKESWQAQVPEPTVPSVQVGTLDNWWEAFQDPQLNALVVEGLANSPTVAQALARFEEALYQTTITGANQYPQLSLNGYGDRRRIPKDLQSSASVPTGNIITPSTVAPIPVPNTGVPPIVVPPLVVPGTPQMKTVRTPALVNDLIANLLVSYEVDFWGKYYLQTQAAKRRAEEAEADLATARLLLVDQIASTYFALQSMDAQIALIREQITLHRELLDLLAQQCDRGLTDAFTLLDEQATLETLLSQEQSFLQTRDLNNSLLATLVGRESNSATFEISERAWSFPIVPVGIPSTLLAQRPDIRSTIKEVEARIAEIGAAKTELLPAISLSAAAGYQAGVAHEWFKWKDRIWDIAASVAQPIFDAGQRFAQVDQAKAAFRYSAASLTQTVLSSVKEVEDALVAIRTQTERRLAALKREDDLTVTSTLRTAQCTAGLQDYLPVLQAKENLIQARLDRINEEYNLQLGTLALMKSLGGSWGSSTPQEATPTGA